MGYLLQSMAMQVSFVTKVVTDWDDENSARQKQWEQREKDKSEKSLES